MIDRYRRPSSLPAAAPPVQQLAAPAALWQREAQTHEDLSRVLTTLARRRKLMLWVFGGFVAAVLAFTLLQHRQYVTEVKMIAGYNNAQTGDTSTGGNTELPILNALLVTGGGKTPETYAELLQQAPVAQDVIQNLKLNTTVGGLLSRVVVRPVTDTSILSLRVGWGDPVTSAKIANTYAQVFVESQRKLVAQQADTAVGFLDQQLPDAQKRMSATQSALAAYQVRTGIADLPSQTQSDITTLAQLEAKQQQAQLDADQATAELDVVRGQLASTPATVVGQQSVAANPVIGQLEAQEATLRGQLDAARQQYTDAHPTVQSLKSQLASVERQLKTQPAEVDAGSQTIPNPTYDQLLQQETTLASTAEGAKAEVKTLEEQRKSIRPRLDRLPEQARRIGDLTREAKTAEAVYDALSRKYQEAIIARTTALSDVTITQSADPRVYTVTPNLILNLIFGILLGIVLALSVAFGADFFDNRFRTEDDVRERLGLPVLASVPQLGSGDWRTNQWAKPLSVEAFYQLVASLRYSSDKPSRSIAFVSPSEGDGKTTVAINTAISMGLMRARVLVVDADLRRPAVHEKLNVPNGSGLSDVLVGLMPFEEAVKATHHQNVWVLTAGRPAPNPVGLLQSEAYRRMLQKAAERFDAIVIDTPALGAMIDGALVARQANGTVLVLSAQRSDVRVVSAALAKLFGLGQINLLGAVLNGSNADMKPLYAGNAQAPALEAASA